MLDSYYMLIDRSNADLYWTK